MTQPTENKHVASTLGTIESVCKPCERQSSHTLCLLFNDKAIIRKIGETTVPSTQH